MAVKLVVKDVCVTYDSVKALDSVSIEFDPSTVTAIAGPNGSGKTTLLRCIDNIIKPKLGVVMLDGRGIEELKRVETARRVGYVPQTERASFPLKVVEVVMMGRRPYVNWSPSARDVKVVMDSLKAVGVENLAERYIDELSGGERQKVIIARALAQEPEVLLLDEPTSNLDIKHQLEIMSLVRKLARERGLIVIAAMHDLTLASRFSDRIVMLKRGKVFAAGPPHEVVTPENIRQVYGVEPLILTNPHLIVVPLEVACHG